MECGLTLGEFGETSWGSRELVLDGQLKWFSLFDGSIHTCETELFNLNPPGEVQGEVREGGG